MHNVKFVWYSSISLYLALKLEIVLLGLTLIWLASNVRSRNSTVVWTEDYITLQHIAIMSV